MNVRHRELEGQTLRGAEAKPVVQGWVVHAAWESPPEDGVRYGETQHDLYACTRFDDLVACLRELLVGNDEGPGQEKVRG